MATVRIHAAGIVGETPNVCCEARLASGIITVRALGNLAGSDHADAQWTIHRVSASDPTPHNLICADSDNTCRCGRIHDTRDKEAARLS